MSGLVRKTFNFIPPAAFALRRLAASLEMSETDVVNRSIQVFDFIEREQAAGGVLLIRNKNGELERVHIL